MIPKVATHILHHTSRAAAAVQNQTIRNVLQIQTTGQSQSTPSSRHGPGSSHWSNNGGHGGSKFNPNNRFYAGYSVRVYPCALVAQLTYPGRFFSF